MANAWGNSQDPSKRLGGLMYGISPTDFSGQTDRLLQQGAYANSQAMAGAGAATQGAIGNAQSNWANALANTQGRGDAVMNDPYTQAALGRFQSVLSGQDVPYTQAVQNQLLARQADATSAGTASQAGMLRDQMTALGGSMADPQAQAAMRQLMAQQQQMNNANQGDMQSKATMANFGARNDAASNLAATRASQLGMANSQYNQASQLYANQQFSGPHQSGVASYQTPVANYNQTGGYGGYTPPTPPPQPQPAPQPQPTNTPPPGGLYTQYVSNSAKPATLPNMSYGSNNYTTGQHYATPQPAVQKNPYGTYNPNLPVY